MNPESEYKLGVLKCTEEFYCKICNDILSYPIMLVPALGNVCRECLDFSGSSSSGDTIIRNEALEFTLSQVDFYCKFYSNGCRVKCGFSDLREHHRNCFHRDFKCPLTPRDDCNFSGSYFDFEKHFNEKHNENVLVTQLNAIVLNINLTRDESIFKFVYAQAFKYLLKLDVNMENNNLNISMYSLDELESTQKVKALFHCNEVKFEKTGIISHCFKYHRAGGTNQVLFSLNTLKELFGENSLNVKIEIICQQPILNKQMEKLLNYFECPVCNNFMRPPIHQCLAGHSICSKCKPKVAQCPTCRTNFGNTRNYAMEALCVKMLFPCVYRDLGCKSVLAMHEIDDHESECVLKPYKCPFNELLRCSWQGVQSAIKAHLKTQHTTKYLEGNHFDATISFASDQKYLDMTCMNYLGQIFRLCHFRDVGNQNGYWAVQLIGPRSEARKYKFEVGLIDTRNPNRKLVRVDMCHDMTSHDNMFNLCIMLPINIMAWFATNGHITYYCDISTADTVDTVSN